MDNNQIIQKIKQENLKPISKNIFLLKRIIVWFLLFISTVFGAYSFAFFFLKTLFIDFDHWYFLSDSYDKFLMENIPIFWVILFPVLLDVDFNVTLAGLLAAINIRHEAPAAILLQLLASIIAIVSPFTCNLLPVDSFREFLILFHQLPVVFALFAETSPIFQLKLLAGAVPIFFT